MRDLEYINRCISLASRAGKSTGINPKVGAVLVTNNEIIAEVRLRKDNTGYDIKQLFLGSEGTLGIITKAVLKLFPLSCYYDYSVKNVIFCFIKLS